MRKIFWLFVLLICVSGCVIENNPPQILQEIEQGLYQV